MLRFPFSTSGMMVGSFLLRLRSEVFKRVTFASRMSQPCIAQALLQCSSSPMEMLLSLRARWQRINRGATSEDADMSEREPQTARALRNWQGLMVRLFQVLESFMVRDLLKDQETVSDNIPRDWHGSGSADGFSLRSWQVVTDTQSQRSLEHMAKCEQMAVEAQHGVYVVLRKCKLPPRVPVDQCPHPATSLSRAGNQWQKEVWCQECYARWKVTTSSPATAASKASPMGKSKARSQPKASAVVEFRCKCGIPAARRVCKKKGVNATRKFFTCEMGICDFFEWDPMETQLLREAMGVERDASASGSAEVIKTVMSQVELEKQKEKTRHLEEELEKKKAELREALESSHSSGAAVERVLQEATAQHHLMMGQSVQAHQAEMAQMQTAYATQTHINELSNHIFWLKAVAGEERVQAVLSDPVLHAQSVQEAVQMKQGAEGPPQ